MCYHGTDHNCNRIEIVSQQITLCLRLKLLISDVDHDGSDGFYITTNINDAVNNRLMHTPIKKCAPENWKEVLGLRSIT